MIVGIGTDLVLVSRFEGALERHGQRLPQRLLAEQERTEYSNASNPARFLAKRFAAKEAIVKALGTGLRQMRWTDICVSHNELGQPLVALTGGAADRARERGIHRWHLSISDERDQVLAFAIAETSG